MHTVHSSVEIWGFISEGVEPRMNAKAFCAVFTMARSKASKVFIKVLWIRIEDFVYWYSLFFLIENSEGSRVFFVGNLWYI